jgi:hypothetical protein
MYYRILVCGQIDGQGGDMYAELRGEVYGHESGCAEASGDVARSAVARWDCAENQIFILGASMSSITLHMIGIEIRTHERHWQEQHRVSRVHFQQNWLSCMVGGPGIGLENCRS